MMLLKRWMKLRNLSEHILSQDNFIIDELKNENIKDVLENGPGLKYSRNTWIEARDRYQGYVLVGGLGAMGVGQMWFKEDEGHKSYEGYEDAPEFKYSP